MFVSRTSRGPRLEASAAARLARSFPAKPRPWHAQEGPSLNEEDPLPKAWSKKDERQYEHIKESSKKRGKSSKRAKEIAAATVNKTRKKQGRTKSQKSGASKSSKSSRSRSKS